MRKGAKKFNSDSAAARFFAAALALCVWQAGAAALGNELLLVTPIAVARRLCGLIVTADFRATLGFTFSRISLGFLLALALAGILAALSAAVPFIETLLRPYVAAIQSVPVASFIILALVWLDSRRLPLFIAALMAFPVVYRNVLEGIRGTSVNTCADILLAYGCRNAINMDGGSSAILWYDGESVTQSSSVTLRYTGGRPLPNAWVYG